MRLPVGGKTLRPGIAMIEMIFALLIMGIALMSLPNLIQTAARSGYVTIQQEAINEASSHLNMVLSYPWDENDADQRYIPPILHVSNGNTDLNESGDSGRRIGTPEKSQRSFIRSDGAEFDASAIGLDSGESGKGDEDDLDDFNGESYTLTLVETAEGNDYVEKGTDINITTTVNYLSDNPDTGGGYQQSTFPFTFQTTGATPTTNIKMVTVTLKSQSNVPELNKTINLRAFSCNIGGTELKEKSF